jgi:iron(III) transport system permease protein
LPPALKRAGGAALALVLLTLLVPFAVLAASAGRGGLQAAASAWAETRLSLLIASASALVSLPLGWALAGELLRRGWRAVAAWFAVVLPLAVPPPLFGLGLAVLWSHVPWLPLYGTLAMPVLATLARGVPVAALLLLAQRRRTDGELLDAARVFQRNALHRWRTVTLPLVARGVLAAAGIGFALALGELGATLLVVPPGEQTLTLRVYAFLHAGASEAVAGLCLLLASLVAAGGFLAGWCVLPRPQAGGLR